MNHDLSSIPGLEAAQQAFTRIKREAQHALAITEIQLCLHQYMSGLVTGTELLNKIATTALEASRLCPGDMDLITGVVVLAESADEFLDRVDASFAVDSGTHFDKDGKATSFPSTVFVSAIPNHLCFFD